MKKQIYMMATMIVLLTVAGLSTAQAQASGTTELRASIPFEFSIGNQTMPAGEYVVRSTNPSSDLKVLQLRSRDGRTSVMVRTNNVIGDTQGAAKLVFNRYGDQYFFAQAWLPADSTGMQASRSRNEKRIARELAGIKPSKESVAISARR
jgi:hypothetical protein